RSRFSRRLAVRERSLWRVPAAGRLAWPSEPAECHTPATAGAHGGARGGALEDGRPALTTSTLSAQDTLQDDVFAGQSARMGQRPLLEAAIARFREETKAVLSPVGLVSLFRE